jgi:predicted dehydrogenase
MINRILIVGYGSIGKRHLRIAREYFPDADIRVLRHKIINTPPKHSNGTFTNISEAVSFNPQIAVIANPATFHIQMAQALAEAGANLLIEKPISSTLSGVKHLIKTVEEKSLILLVGYNLRFLRSLQFFKEQLDKSIVGKVLSVRCEMGNYLPSWRPESNYRDGVSASKELGGGALLELSHELDFLRWIFGDVEWVKSTLSQQSSLDIDVEDTVHLTLGFTSKTKGYQLIGSVNLDFIRHDVTRTCTVIGEKGSLQWNGITDQVLLYKACASEWTELATFISNRDDSYISEWGNFEDCLLKNGSPVVTGTDGLKVLQIIEAARKSSKSCRKELVT